MSKYITAEQINNAVALCKDEPFSKVSVFAITEMLPSADVVEVVRCKDCKHCEKPFNSNRRDYCEKRSTVEHTEYVNPTDYCSKGKRKETE